MVNITNLLLVIGIMLSIMVLGAFILLKLFYRKVSQGQALIRTGKGTSKVSFSGMYILPVIHQAEVMDTTIKTIILDQAYKDALICKDGTRVDIKAVFYVRVNSNMADVMRVAQTVGPANTFSSEFVNQLFKPKFLEGLKIVAKHFTAKEIYDAPIEFKHQLFSIIGKELNGYFLDDIAIDLPTVPMPP